VDDGYTGVNFDRPAFQAMLEDIKEKQINCVVVKDEKRKQRIKILCEFFRSRRERELDKGKARHHAVGYRAFPLFNAITVRAFPPYSY
jgi:DNA invertase Pin-like site-specific DNA recombinase